MTDEKMNPDGNSVSDRRVHRCSSARASFGPVVFFLMLSLILAGCGEKPKQFAPPPPTVTVVQPVERKVTDYLELTGNTQAVKTAQLRARVAGYLEKVLFQDGQFVKEGQPLFLIQQNTYEANLKQAEADILTQKTRLRRAQIELERYTKLLSQKAAAELDVDNWVYERDSAQATLLSSEAKRDLAKLDLSYTLVTAPFDGRIDRRLADPGNLVGASEVTVLAVVNQINPIYVYFNISDSDLTRLTEEAHWSPAQSRTDAWPLHMGLPADKGYPRKGSLSFASISLAATTGTLLVRGTFPNPDGKILPGLYARLRVPLKERKAFLVPQEALGHDQRGPYLLAVDQGGMVDRVGVSTGTLVDNFRAINAGLTGKEWIVVNGMQKAIPGRKVTPEKQISGKTAAP
jgi:RND family efflux transporter MFP subunit